jgi:phenylpropionate dioxygenase-like ring-hydroxylating dioxygenase large terminal subunit
VETRYADSKTHEIEANEMKESAVHAKVAFNWSKQWYPAVVIRELDPHIPNAFTLLGRDLVIWRDTHGTWR